MRTSDFDYHLPPEQIAQTPLEPRDSSRLLVLHRATGQLEHRRFHEIAEYLSAGDVMVFNQSRVLPARLYGRRKDTGGRVEFLLLRRDGPGIWQALARPGRRLKPGAKIYLNPPGGVPPLDPPSERAGLGGSQPGKWSESALEVEVLASHADGIKTLRLESEEVIGLLGEMPLPPYIHQKLEDPERYQTVYARDPGSAAAPTAGLHFTQGLMGALKDAGVHLVFVTLHVGLDTFRPVQGDDPTRHKIHTEYFELGADAAGTLNRAHRNGRRVIAVGTTAVRVLEQAALLSLAKGVNQVEATTGQADLFILPGHRFRMVDGLVTNFHLPRSTLLMLVSAFAGQEPILRAYQEAIERKYRFYSFGDCMVII